jgi:hypothetical protein
MERLNEKLGDACAGGGFLRSNAGTDDCNHADIQDLIQRGASIRDSRALFLAASNGQPETIKLLLRLGGSRLVNEQDEHGNTPLHVAAGMKDPTCIKVLLDNGANKQLVDRKGRTPLQGLDASKRNDEKFAREMGFDRMRPTAASAATKAREAEKFAQCRRLLTGQMNAASSSAAANRKWCTRCEENKSLREWQITDPRVCAACKDDMNDLCDECWPDFGAYCEGCNKFECTECDRGQRGWNHMYGPRGDIGISCASCKPWSSED